MQVQKTILALLILAFAAIPVHAQISSPNTEGRIVISMTPESPVAGEYVRLSAASATVDLQKSDVTWYADTKIIAQGEGITEAGISAGPAGSAVDVVVIAQSADGTAATGEAFIRPTIVDIVWESDSYTPPFYKGRALPSAGTNIRAQAMTNFRLTGGTPVPAGDITYTWRRNGAVTQTASGRGRSFAIFPAPTLFGTDVIEVETVSADGTLSGKTRVNISSVEPVLVLYENHPVFGIFYSKAFGQTATVKDAEVTFAAVPYFAEAGSADDPQLVYQWQVNGQNITADYARPSEITINSDKSNGTAALTLSLTRLRNWYMRAEAGWNLSFPNAGGGGTSGTDPFKSPAQ